MRQRIEIFLFHAVLRLLAFLTAGHLPALVVASGLIEEDGRILFVRRRDGRGLNFPGGYLTYREDPAEGAIREVREETGYLAEAGPLLGVYGPSTPGRVAGSILLLYQMRRTGGQLKSSHEGDPAWLTPEEALGERFDHGTDYMLQDYLARRAVPHPQSRADESK